MADRVLVVTSPSVPAARVSEAVRRRVGADAEVQVVAPVANVSPTQWLTDDVDRAREDAARQAVEVADRLPADAEPYFGDSDPLLAIEDALRVFPAERIVFVTAREEEASWLEAGKAAAARERFSIPVTHLVVDEPTDASPGDDGPA